MIQPPRRRIARLATVLALAVLALLPAAAPAVAADPVVLRVGTTQDLEATNPWNTYLVSSYDVVPAHLRPAHRVRQGRQARRPGSPTRGSAAADRVTFHIRDGMKCLGRHAGDGARTCASVGPRDGRDQGREVQHRLRLPRPGLKDAGVTKIECPDDSTFIAYTTDQSDRIFQVYVPILPKHVWASSTTRRSHEEKFDAPLVGTGPYTLAEWKTNQFARFVRNPNYWGNAGLRRRGRPAVLPGRRHDGPGAEGGRARLRPQRQRGPVQAAPGRPDLHRGRRQGERLDASSRSTPTEPAPARPSRTAARRPRRCSTRPSATRSATRSTSRPSSTACWAASATSAPPTSRPSCPMARRAGQPRALRHRARQAEARRGRLRAERRRQAPRQGGQADQPAPVLPEHGRRLREVGAVRAGVVRPAGHRRHAAGLRQRHPRQPRPAARGRRQGQLRHRAVGLGAATRTRTRCCRSSAATRSARRRTASTATRTYDALYDQQSKQAGDASATATLAQMQNLIYDQAPYDVLFYDANLDVYRNDKFAGWQNMPANGTPLFTYGTAQLHAAHGRDGRSRRPRRRRRPPRRPRRRQPRRRRRRRRPAPRPRPAARRSSSGSGSEHHAAARARGGGRRRGRRRRLVLLPPPTRSGRRRGRIAGAAMTPCSTGSPPGGPRRHPGSVA